MTAVTQWFKGNQKPKHVGVYHRDFWFFDGVTYAKWDGRKWLRFSHEFALAESETYKSDWQDDPWRGVAR